jgi:CRISPR-associated protein Cas5t
MRVLKIELEGLTASFRYPHFAWGRQPTFPMPPPATIFGHICGALGAWIDPADLLFGYVFSFNEQATDIEHCHAVSVAGARSKFEWRGQPVRTNTEGVVNPLKRDFLFLPRLTLYLNRPDWERRFRQPRYAVVLGRSQDLATYTRITTVALQQSDQAYYEKTLLPFAWRVRTGRGITLTMPRLLDYENSREPQFDRYVALQERSFTRDWLSYESIPLVHWVDPESSELQGVRRGVALHAFTKSAGE